MGSRQNNYGLETNWSRVIGNVNALAGNFEPTSSLNGSRGVGIMMGTQGNAKALQGDRVFIAGQRTVDALQAQMVAQKTYVAGMYPNFNGSGASYIIKASWFRAKTRARLEYTKWAKLRRMEASIQNELHRRAASVSCSYIVPRVMFHGFVEGVFYVVSHMPGKLTPIDTFLASTPLTPAKAMLAYRAVEGTIHALWMLDATPMRVAKHTFALLSNGRGFYPMAIVLDYNNVLAFNEPVRRELRGKMTTYIGQQNVCAPLRSKEGTLEHIWSVFRSSAAWRGAAQKYKDIFVKKHKSEKDVGQYLRNILMFAKRLDASRGSGASRGPGAPPRRRRTMLGGALRGILRGRGGGRRASSNNKNSPPLKIRKVATLPETDGWRPRKHSATWGAASRNKNNNGGRRVSRNPGPRYITSGTSGNGSSTYTPAAKTADSDSDSEGEGEESSAPRVGNGLNGLGAGILGGAANANAAANATTPARANRNAVNRYTRIKDSWSSWTEAQKNEAVKTEINRLEADPSLRAELNVLKRTGGNVEKLVHAALFKEFASYREKSHSDRQAILNLRLPAVYKNTVNAYTRGALEKGNILNTKSHLNLLKKRFKVDANAPYKRSLVSSWLTTGSMPPPPSVINPLLR